MITIGTAGYAYEDWVGPFYPPGMDKKQWLEFYGKQFSFTEVNSSFYRMPSPYMLAKMAEKTPVGFKFAVKAYRGITHERHNSAEDCRKLVEAVKPLVDADKLACILLQFPASYHNTRENRSYLADISRYFQVHPTTVEFRHKSWAQPAVFSYLESLNLGYVCVDEPQFENLMPPVVVATAAPAYVRFHGRNYEKWWNHKEAYERYNYLYTAEELAEWVPKLRELEKAAGQVYVAMNNHYQGKAAINAKMLQELLGSSQID
ncbi:MAG TPA: DUF72 domain-containing protein [Firmicutes bacterium]|nr:DUF72 domain-containing protein [Bacillota bacterium]